MSEREMVEKTVQIEKCCNYVLSRIKKAGWYRYGFEEYNHNKCQIIREALNKYPNVNKKLILDILIVSDEYRENLSDILR